MQRQQLSADGFALPIIASGIIRRESAWAKKKLIKVYNQYHISSIACTIEKFQDIGLTQSLAISFT